MAEAVRTYFLTRQTDDWELALVHTVHAHAASAAGAVGRYRDSYARAVDAIAAIADEEDRRIVLETFAQVPEPGQVDGG